MKIEHILIPTDFSNNSKRALEYAIELRKKYPAQVTLLHVIEPIVTYGSEISITPVDLDIGREEGAQASLKELAIAFDEEVALNTVCLRGRPWRAICDWASENKVDLIVMPTHGYSGLLHMWLGSVAERVVQKAPCPVLVIRATD